MCPARIPAPPAKKNKIQNSPKQSVIPPPSPFVMFFILTSIKVLSRKCNVRICAKFHKKPNGSQEIEKKYHKADQKIPQNVLQERRSCSENFFQCSENFGVIQKTSLPTFMRKGLTALNK